MKPSAFILSILWFATLSACTPGTSGSTLPTCPSTIAIENFAFTPDNCQLESGTTITFVNEDTAPHTATSDESAAAVFDTGTLEQGQSALVTFADVGTYLYFCKIHPSMVGTITVVESVGAVSELSSEDESEESSY